MKAAVWYGQNNIRVEDITEPVPGPGQVKIKINACGICGSDLHEFRQGPFIIPVKPHPLTGQAGGPVVLGHEFSAEVVQPGSNVTGFNPGDRVTVNALITCNECHYCKKGAYNMCVKLGSTGFAADGGFAEYAVVNDYALFHLPDSVSDDMGSFIEPLAVSVRAVKRSRMKIGDSVAIIGAGPIGLLVMQVCLVAGASQVFVVEPIKARRDLAKKLGAAAVFNPFKSNPGKKIAELTNGLRTEIAFDCVGNQPAFNTALSTTGRRGTICIVGLSMTPVEVPFIRLWGHEKEIVFSCGYENEFTAALALMADKRIDIQEMISERIQLEDIVEKGIEPLIGDAEKYIKIVVYP
ncbi:MAG: 2,3-butanediol dehydrogenase [Desulfobacteraceae bacterium]|nr:2,3-butanediol dehydrogenase [Desulfobacteraceae bacterium]